MCFNTTTDSFCEMIMEIKITAVKQKSAYLKADSTLGSLKAASVDRYFPLFELMRKELQNNQEKNQQRSEI